MLFNTGFLRLLQINMGQIWLRAKEENKNIVLSLKQDTQVAVCLQSFQGNLVSKDNRVNKSYLRETERF